MQQLPVALLPRILRHVPLSDRLSKAALVCRDWAKAATLSVQHLEYEQAKPWPEPTEPALMSWLTVYGGQLESLQLEQFFDFYGPLGLRPAFLLPWAALSGLQSLILHHVQMPLYHASHPRDHSSRAAITYLEQLPAPALPHLRRLELHWCEFPALERFMALANNPRLTCLLLDRTEVASREEQQEVFCGLLQRLPELRVFHLNTGYLGDTGPYDLSFIQALHPHITALRNLQDLGLSFKLEAPDSASSLEGLFNLPLQHLHISEGRYLTMSDYTTLPGPSQPAAALTGLTHLLLSNARVFPALLGSMASLRHVELDDCDLLPCAVGEGARLEGVDALLGALGRLSKLEHLDLRETPLFVPGPSPAVGPPLGRYSALTASTQLSALWLWGANGEGGYDGSLQPLRKGCIQHMFPPGRQLPALQTLCFIANSELIYGDGGVVGCMDGQDLESVISACPALGHLNLAGVVGVGSDLSPLLQVPASLTHLVIEGAAFGDDAARSVVSRLTQLHSLRWEACPGLTDEGVQHLTALQRLTYLGVRDSGVSQSLSKGYECDSDSDDEQALDLLGRHSEVRRGRRRGGDEV